MPPLLAHAGEEVLFVLVPIVMIVLLVQFGKRRNRDANQPPEAGGAEDPRVDRG